jgi:hypothetical protein
MYSDNTTRNTLWKITRLRIHSGSFFVGSLGTFFKIAKPEKTMAKYAISDVSSRVGDATAIQSFVTGLIGWTSQSMA